MKKDQFQYFKEVLRAQKRVHTVTYNGSKIELEFDKKRYVFEEYAPNEYLYIIRLVKEELIQAYLREIEKPEKAKFYKQISLSDFFTHYPNKSRKKIKIKYIGWNKEIKLIQNKELYQIDISSAYIYAAHKLGYLSNNLFHKIEGIKEEIKDNIHARENFITQTPYIKPKNNIKDIVFCGKKNIKLKKEIIEKRNLEDKLKRIKYAALSGIGSITKVITVEKNFYEENQEVKSIYYERLHSHIIRQAICYEIDNIMQECLREGAIFFWVDAIFCEKEKVDYFQEKLKNLGYNTKIIKYICNFADNKIYCKGENGNKVFNLSLNFDEYCN